jgi:outer membrane protein TolC
MTAPAEIACVPTAVRAAPGQREIMAKIAEARSEIIDLRLDVEDALTELVSVTDWADDDAPAEQPSALEKVTACRQRLAAAEADIARLQQSLVEYTTHRP